MPAHPLRNACLGIALTAPLAWMAWPQTDGGSHVVWIPGQPPPQGMRSGERGDALPPGLCSLSSLVVRAGAVIDHEESDLAAYLDGRFQGSGHAQAWALDSIEIEANPDGSPTVVIGDAQSGWSGGTALEKGAFVTGSIEPRPTRRDWPSLEAWDSSDWTSETWDAGEHGFAEPLVQRREVLLLGTSELRLAGPLELQVDRLMVEDQSRVRLDTTAGPIVLQIAEGWSIGAEAHWDSTLADPTQVAIWIGQGEPEIPEHIAEPKSDAERRAHHLRERLLGGGFEASEVPVMWAGQGELRGQIYAPFSHLQLTSALPMRGTLIARHIELGEGARFTAADAAGRATFGIVRQP